MTVPAAAAAPKHPELSGTPCGSGVCSYLAGDDDDYWDKDWHEWTDDDWDNYWDDYTDDEDNWDDEGDWAARLPAPSVEGVRETPTVADCSGRC